MELIDKLTNICGPILWIAAELEILFCKPNDPLFLRRLSFNIQKVKYGKKLWVGRGFRLAGAANLTLGERCALGDFVIVTTHAPITIGDDFIGATGLHMDSGTHDPATLKPKAVPITIGSRVWCGINVTIIAGVTIGDDVVIGAGSVVCQDIPSNSIAAGVPAKVIKPLDRKSHDDLWTWVR